MTLHSGGDTVGNRYEVTRFVGEGGMQEVYAAKDLVLERVVAVKVPKTTAAVRRFKRSAVLSAKVSHPNVAKTLDYIDDSSSSRPYLIEEFIEGQDLQQVRARMQVTDPYLVAHLLHHVARGVSASHHVGVVHRDLKPSNIMVSSGLEFSAVKVTDFGISKMAVEELAAAVEGGDETITGSHTMMGALPYMAPEMIQSPRSTSTPTDVWAVGAICYELLTGSKPFGTGLVAVPNILQGQRVPPSRLLQAPQFGKLCTEIVGLIDRCLVLDPTQRISIDELVGECGKLCYSAPGRKQGIVREIRHNSWGFIGSGASSVFFNLDSVYGPPIYQGDTVCYADFPGDPSPRAHPVVKLTG